MSIIHVRQIRAAIEQSLQGEIDLSDVVSAPSEQKEANFLTRGLAAFSLMLLADVDAVTAGAAVVDGTGDNGIDALLHNQRSSFGRPPESSTSSCVRFSVHQAPDCSDSDDTSMARIAGSLPKTA